MSGWPVDPRWMTYQTDTESDEASDEKIKEIPGEPCDHECTCDIMLLMRQGCTCGGV